jgi:hypothetical protein
MDGKPFDVFLPPMAMGDVVTLSPTEDTDVGFGAAGKAQLQALFPNLDPSVWEKMKVTYPAGSAVDKQGNVATEATVIPVPPDRLPAPLPPGQDPGLVISIQALGATNFDTPAPVTFPNLTELGPGEKSLIWSFNHDAGRWEVIGAGTISNDGLSVLSDLGVGVLAPGWHFTQPGTETEGPDDETPPEEPPCLDGREIVDTIVDIGAEVASCLAGFTGLRESLGAIFDIAANVRELIDNVSSAIEEAQSGGTAGTVRDILRSVLNAKEIVEASFEILQRQNPLGRAMAISRCIEGLLNVADGICDRVQDDPECNTLAVRVTCIGIGLARTQLAQVNDLIEAAEEGLRSVAIALLCAKIDQLATILNIVDNNPSSHVTANAGSRTLVAAALEDDDPVSPEVLPLLQEVKTEADATLADAAPVEAWAVARDGVESAVKPLPGHIAEWSSEWFGAPAGSRYAFALSQGLELRGRAGGDGRFTVVLPPNTDFQLTVFDPASRRVATHAGRTNASGGLTRVPSLLFASESLVNQDGQRLYPDAEGDGLSDLAERRSAPIRD